MKIINLKNEKVDLKIITIGASILEFNYQNQNLILSLDRAEDYYQNPEYLGCTVAPLAGRYLINDKIVLHSDELGLHNKEFAIIKQTDTELELECNYLIVKYILLKDGFRIEFKANLDTKVPLNITNHSYFCLDGQRNINTHKVLIDSDYMAQKNADNLAIGVVKNVISEIDFSKEKPDDYYYFKNDKCFRLISTDTDISLEISTSYDGVVFYTYNQPQNEKNKHSAVAIEAQNPPNSFKLYDKYDEFIEYKVLTGLTSH